ncbi:SDR family oxidoreductase [Bordetella pseudohinzii]|uniref:Gluconate 5-dehydrogenase n=1 Tax=Bordetella pseudohinzii TaxID=1331258 RepID=A0A0J6BY64_9BORD|nr:SDR family oxidoreductase [Bordetella pseudohinzii]ANY14456.1 gluconate 5-dehydrogenase [Bordetella pseudohinzii]KMM26634.1 gluconate 5-dehydrogenase [Bordetella pseudohinzii]KXA79180.1 gluconate 5-dehydrogenase [Bordetella pseudohinzii]KXA80991.1 gluconate 5-dehydrogenase [Bordetella pseudohinzii]CUI64994.1 Gluconate 5-dehydrogenase [Bordetella pseudohinzii]
MMSAPTLPPSLSYLQQFSLAGQVALITGSVRGLGWEIARAMAASGAHVLINGRNAAAAEAAAQGLREAGLDASALPFDVADEAGMRAAFAEIDARRGRLDILVNNVGARNRKTLRELELTEIRELIDTDLVAGIMLAKLAAERMLRQGGGRLIAITSVVGELARAGDAVYPAAKQGLTGMMRALAAEFGPAGITSNAIAPGTFATETNAAMVADPAVGPRLAARNPMGRWGQPHEIAGAAVFLASPAASFINGQVLAVDGGLSVQF